MNLVEEFCKDLESRNPNQPEFIQAVREIAESIIPFIEKTPRYQNKGILERLVEPERIISFRVVWLDDNNTVRVNKGYRVEYSSTLGPYKGGLRPECQFEHIKVFGI